jgi:hypothetical protein
MYKEGPISIKINLYFHPISRLQQKNFILRILMCAERYKKLPWHFFGQNKEDFFKINAKICD